VIRKRGNIWPQLWVSGHQPLDWTVTCQEPTIGDWLGAPAMKRFTTARSNGTTRRPRARWHAGAARARQIAIRSMTLDRRARLFSVEGREELTKRRFSGLIGRIFRAMRATPQSNRQRLSVATNLPSPRKRVGLPYHNAVLSNRHCAIVRESSHGRQQNRPAPIFRRRGRSESHGPCAS